MKKRHAKIRRSAISAIVAVTMVVSLSFTPALASAADESQGLTATGSSQLGTPEWAIDDGQNSESGMKAQAAPPVTYDLRSEDLVTPVKLQNPWGSCWAFGGTAAAEISLLSAYGSTYEDSKLDLSERHLTYFALQPVTEDVDPSQVGEGMYTIDPSANAAYDAGGFPIFITTLFSQGVGPMTESDFPYRGVGADGKTHTTLEYLDVDAEAVVKDQIAAEAQQQGKTYDQIIAEIQTNTGETEAAIIERVEGNLREYYKTAPITYSKFDDWSIPAKNANGTSNRLLTAGVVLKNGNVLPAYRNTDGTINESSKLAIQQELLNGRGVSIKYFAVQAPDDTYLKEVPGEGNASTYNQYIDSKLGQNHGVCIVGWDNSYSRSNFAKDPGMDGAWIVKNSWGSETDVVVDDLEHEINKGTYGNKDKAGKATGYFYLSYNDMTIDQPESMEFSSNLGGDGGFYALQYDYMPAFGGFYTTPTSSDVMSSANVFTADNGIVIKSVSTRTSETNTRVTFAIYELNDNPKDPTDGEMLYRTSQNFEYGGFHRLDLERQITIKAGKKFSVVSTASTVGDNGKRSYNVSANRGASEKAVQQTLAANPNQKIKSYSAATVNEGESFLYVDKKWQDWKGYTSALAYDPVSQQGLEGDSYIDLYPIDNFSIKVYAEAEAVETIDISGASVTVAKATYTGKTLTPKVTVKIGDKTLAEGTDYKVTYANNKKAGTGVAVVAGMGAYTGAKTKTFTIAKATNTLKAKAVKKTQKAKYGEPTTIKASKAFKVTKNVSKGKVSYKLSSVSKKAKGKITVTSAGKVTVKSTLAPGTYTVKFKLTSAATTNYKAKSTNVSFKVKVS